MSHTTQKSPEEIIYSDDGNCHLTFDGKNLRLYKNNILVKSLSAMSGKRGFQERRYQPIPDKGPLPEGLYYLRQNRRQNLTLGPAFWGIFERGTWPKTVYGWGLKRVWLDPDENNNMFGRDGFTIHGGFSKGSGGCIDIPYQTDVLSDYLDTCQETTPLKVRYPYERW